MGLVLDDTVRDADGNPYTPITIGTQTWLVENLKTTHYNNGDPITIGDANWPTTTSGMYKTYSSTNYLYNQYAAYDIRGICPIGYHIPTIAEWQTLSTYLGGNSISARHLKRVGEFVGDVTSDNSSGFTMLATGIVQENGSITNIGTNAILMGSLGSAVAVNNDSGTRDVFYTYPNGAIISTDRYGRSIRCIKD